MSSKMDIFDKISAPKGDIFDRISPENKELSKTRSVISAPVKGIIKGAEELSQLHDPLQMVLNQLIPKKESALSQVSEKVLPTRNETTENFLERSGKLIPNAALGGSGLINSLIQAGAGGIAGELAKAEGVGETGQGIAEAVGMGIPGIAKAIGKQAISLAKSPVEKLSSGLTKPRAIGAKLPEKGVITSSRQEKLISNLNNEASKLSEKVVEKELPFAKHIEQGMDFEGQYKQRFGNLQKIAEKANPEIDTSSVSKFMSNTSSKYRGIPKLHPEAEKIKKEIKAFQNQPLSDLKRSLRTYRSNNKKIRGIYETSRTTGKQAEYVDFLVDYNRNLTKSFEKTLPKDSPWIKEFKETNSIYKQYKDTQKALHIIEPILKQKATPASITKFADDPKLLQKLELSMGKKGASEISQIAKDLRTATDSIKNISVKDLKWYEAVLPLGALIPGVHIPGGILTAKKAYDFSKRGYGWFLSTASRRNAYGNALKGLMEDNRSLYLKAAEELKKSLTESEED